MTSGTLWLLLNFQLSFQLAKLTTDHIYFQIRNYKKAELDSKGVHAVAQEIIQRLELDKNPVHISFDIDALDPPLAPSTGTKVPEGLSVEDVVHIFKEIKKTGNLVSCDIVEFNPLIGSENDVETTISSISPVLKEILWKFMFLESDDIFVMRIEIL